MGERREGRGEGEREGRGERRDGWGNKGWRDEGGRRERERERGREGGREGGVDRTVLRVWTDVHEIELPLEYGIRLLSRGGGIVERKRIEHQTHCVGTHVGVGHLEEGRKEEGKNEVGREEDMTTLCGGIIYLE